MPKHCVAVARALQPDQQHVQALQAMKHSRRVPTCREPHKTSNNTPALQTRKARLREVGSLSKLSLQRITGPGETQDLPQHPRSSALSPVTEDVLG